jgi:hypothetical protein
MSVRGSVLAIALFFAAMQMFVLPPDGFVTGDQGSKYLQTRAFAMHGPLDPSIDVASRDIDPEYRHQEPKLKNRRGRLVSEFLWLLPLLGAPFFALFGMRGLYIVPALSVIVIFLAAAALGRRVGGGRGVWTAWVVAAATPAIVYGLELWEHAPAAACVLVAAALLAPARRRAADLPAEAGSHASADPWLPPSGGRTADPPPSGGRTADLPPSGGTADLPAEAGSHAIGGSAASRRSSERRRSIAAGAAIAVGFLFREEVIAALPAFAVARALAVERDRMRELITTGVWIGVGAAAVFIASVPMNLLIYGAPLPMHITQDAWEVATSTPYMQVRRDVVVDLLLPGSHIILFFVAAIAGLAASIAQANRRPQQAAADRRLLRVVHASVFVMLTIAVFLPLWTLVDSRHFAGAYRATSVVHTWPFALAILYLPWTSADVRPTARFLIVSALLLLIGTALVIPTSGGGQWSPRFLLAVAPLLAVVAAIGADPTRENASGGVRPGTVVWMTRAILAASLVMQTSGVVLFSRAKIRHGEMTAWVANRTAPGYVLLTDVFSFNELTATLAPTRRMLFSWVSADIPAMAALAVQHGLPRFAVVTSVPVTGHDAAPVVVVPGAPCRFVRGQRISLNPSGLTLSRYACEEP